MSLSADAAPLGDDDFAALMAPLGPWAGARQVAIAVSGGADSLCLALLAARWGAARGIAALCLIVDHGLRRAAAEEAVQTLARLSGCGIQGRILTLDGLLDGPALAARARSARYAALSRACRDAGIVDLLVGHHAGDQAETVLMRRRAASGGDGLAGMAALVETADIRLLRPLLAVPPMRLRRRLQAMALDWVEDPSNRDRRALRTRLRDELAAPAQAGLAAELLAQSAHEARSRTARDAAQAEALAASVLLYPQGFALLPPALISPRALSALIRTVTGAAYAPNAESVASLVRRPRAATLGGARLLPAGRFGPGWVLAREAAAMQGPVAAVPGVIWDHRFTLCDSLVPEGAMISAAGRDRPAGFSRLPAALRSVMPVLRDHDYGVLEGARFVFTPALATTAQPQFNVFSSDW